MQTTTIIGVRRELSQLISKKLIKKLQSKEELTDDAIRYLAFNYQILDSNDTKILLNNYVLKDKKLSRRCKKQLLSWITYQYPRFYELYKNGFRRKDALKLIEETAVDCKKSGITFPSFVDKIYKDYEIENFFIHYPMTIQKMTEIAGRIWRKACA